MPEAARKGEWLEWRLSRDKLKDLDSAQGWLERTAGFPPAFLAKLVKQGGLRLMGDRLRVWLFPQEEPGFEPQWADLDVLYEDDFSLVAGKPAGCKVHPTDPEERDTLANAVAAYYEGTGQKVAVRHVHRLDADTSGPVLYAKGPLARLKLDEAMRAKRIGRIYHALAEGRLQPPLGRIEASIGRDRHHPSRRRVSPGGQAAATRYRTLESLPGFTLLELELETGRTHQIRVHLSWLGHPLAGDRLYGARPGVMDRQALHGAKLIYPDVLSGDPIEVAQPYPRDLAELLERLREAKG